MTNDEYEVEWVENLRAQAANTVDLLGNARRKELERRTCAAFLRCAGISFETGDLQASEDEPPDVLFRSACFEVTVVYDKGRTMHQDWKVALKRRSRARKIEELFDPYHPPETKNRQAIVDSVIEASQKKVDKYIARGRARSDLELLVYVNQNVVMDGTTPKPACNALTDHGWRTVSILVPPQSYVVLAGDEAPKFLVDQLDIVKASWPELSGIGLFEI